MNQAAQKEAEGILRTLNGSLLLWWSSLLSVPCLAAQAPLATAQTPIASQAQVSRPEIEAAIAEAEKIANSPGYSGRLRDAKRQEIARLRSRLTDGDLQAGDQVILTVQGEPDLSKAFLVGPSRYLTLPAIGDISLKGVLRSELEEYLAKEIRRYLRDPVVHAQTTIRLSFLGAVGRPGYYQIPAGILVSDAIMAAGGPASGVDPSKTRVERSGVTILSKEEFAKALTDGRTVDQLSLQAGDEILLGGDRVQKGVRGGGLVNVVLPVMSAGLGLTYLFIQILK